MEPGVPARRRNARDRARRAGCASSATACSIRSPSRACRPCSAMGLSGLMDVALHPQVRARTTSSISATTSRRRARTTRRRSRAATLDGEALTDVRDIFVDAGRRRRVAHRVRPRRHALHDDRRRRRQRRAGSQQPRRQGAAAARRWQRADRQSVRRASRATSPRSTRSATAARSASRCIPAPARCGRTRTVRTAATRSTSSSPARTTAGRS